MKLKKTGFWKAFELIKKNRKKSFYMLCFDALFLVVLLLLNKLVLQRMPEPYALYGGNPATILFFTLSYFAFLLFFYSFTKYMILLMIKSTNEKVSFTMKDYLRFALLNLMMGALIFFALVILSLILNFTVKQESVPVAGALVFLVLAFFFYLFFNIAHTLFILGSKILETIRKSFTIIFKKARVYSPVLLNIIIMLIIYFIFTLLLSLIMKKFYFNKTAIVLLQLFYNAVSVLLFYAVLFFNRIQLFEALKRV